MRWGSVSRSGSRDGFGKHGGRGADPRHGHDRFDGRPMERPQERPMERRGGRLGRLFAHGDLHLLVLFMIAEKPRHGYELIKSIEARMGGAYSPSPGTIYPALTLLEEQGYIHAEASEGNRRLFAITAPGTAYLAANQAQVDQMLARMSEVRERRGDAPAPVVRAMENLKFALRLRMERGPLSDAEAQAVAVALDTAAVTIERS